MQNALVAIAHRGPDTVANIARLRERAAAAGVPVVTVQHQDGELEPGTEGWRIVPELAPAPGEVVVPKAGPDSFLGTGLDATLRGLGVTELVVTGFATEICVESTARQALSLHYDVVLVADAHTTSLRPGPGPYAAPEASVAPHEIYRNLRYPGRRIRVLPAAEVDFTADAAVGRPVRCTTGRRAVPAGPRDVRRVEGRYGPARGTYDGSRGGTVTPR